MSYTLTCKDWKETLLAIREASNLLGNPEKIWYRGQSNSTFELKPSLFRVSGGLILESEMFRKFKQLDSRFGENSLDDWDILYKMQHFGIPTRLLDWSEVVGVSLFFATKFNQLFENGQSICLYALDPLKMNQKIFANHTQIMTLSGKNNERIQLDYVDTYLSNSNIPIVPIAIRPNKYNNNRILAQSGVFTVHPNTQNSLEKLCPECVVKIIINNSAIPEIVEILEITNVNDITIYPDMHGVAEYFRTLLSKECNSSIKI